MPDEAAQPSAESASTKAESVPSSPRAARQPVPPVLLGILCMAGAALSSGCMAGAVRQAAADIHPLEIVFFRNVFAVATLTPWLVGAGWGALRTHRIAWHGTRAILNMVAMMFYYIALAITPLAKASSLTFVSPLFATLFAVMFLGEAIRARRVTALLVGFVGALVIIRPGTEAMSTGALMALTSAAFWGLTLVVIKMLARTESSVTIAAYASLLPIPLSLIPALFVWQWPSSPEIWGWLALVGFLGASQHLLGAQAFRLADATAVLPLDFTKLVWAALVGYVAFAEVPEIWTWIGAIIVFASSIYISIREGHAHSAAPAAAPPA